MVHILPENIFKTIFHISDLHIHNSTRYQEYQLVLETLIQSITNHPAYHPETSLIINTGDTLDKAAKMTAEAIQQVQEFRQRLSKLAYNIWIPGNHDIRVDDRQKSEIDSLSAILAENHNGESFTYLKDNTVILVGQNLTISHISVFRPPDSTPAQMLEAIPQDRTKIALFHGMIDSAVSGDGYLLRNCEFKLDAFKDYDMTLLGDVHRFQRLTPSCAYAGSLIQQNFGEPQDIHGGCIVWNIKDNTSEFMPIHNDFGYVTLHVTKGHLDAPPSKPLPKYTRLKLVYDTDTKTNDLRQIKVQLEREGICKIIQTRTTPKKVDPSEISSTITDDIYGLNQQLVEYLENHYTNEQVESLYDLDIHYKSELGLDDLAELSTEPIQLLDVTWSNLFIYEGAHQLPFQSLHPGIKSIYGSNKQGKSKLVDILLISLFGVTPKLCHDVISKQTSKKATTEIYFQKGSTRYRISRSFRKKKQTGETTVSLSEKQDDAPEWVESNRKTKPQIEHRIRELVGDEEIMTQTSISKQENHQAFLALKSTDRKSFLKKLLDTEQYDKLGKRFKSDMDKLKSDYITPTKCRIADLEKAITEENGTELRLVETTRELTTLRLELDTLASQLGASRERHVEINVLQTKIDHVNETIQLLQNKLVSTNISSTDEYQVMFDSLTQTATTLRQDLKTKQDKISKYNQQLVPILDETKVAERLAQLNEAKHKTTVIINDSMESVATATQALIETRRQFETEQSTRLQLDHDLKQLKTHHTREKWSHCSNDGYKQTIEAIIQQIDLIQIKEIQHDLSNTDGVQLQQDYQAYQHDSDQQCHVQQVLHRDRAALKQRQEQLTSDPFHYNECCQDCNHNSQINRIPQLKQDITQLQDRICQTQLLDTHLLESLHSNKDIPTTYKDYQQYQKDAQEQLRKDKRVLELDRLQAEYTDWCQKEAIVPLQQKLLDNQSQITILESKIISLTQTTNASQSTMRDAQLELVALEQQIKHGVKEESEIEGNQRLRIKILIADKTLTRLEQSLATNQVKQTQLEEDRRALETNRQYQTEYDAMREGLHSLETKLVTLNNQSSPDQLKQIIKPLQVKIDNLMAEKTLIKQTIQNTQRYLESLVEHQTTLADHELERQLLENYYHVTKHFPEQHIKNSSTHLADEANKVLLNLNSDFTIDIDPDTLDFTKLDSDTKTNIEYCSGFERFAISMALRYALTRIGHTPSIDTLIIDEGFGVLDREHLANIGNWLEPLQNIYQHLFIITHIDELQSNLPRKIKVDQGTLDYKSLLR